jgi:hypothetical protein
LEALFEIGLVAGEQGVKVLRGDERYRGLSKEAVKA